MIQVLPQDPTLGKTAVVMGVLTIWADCWVQWGLALESPKSVPIQITRANIVENGKKMWRIGFHLKNQQAGFPFWWGAKHKRKIEMEMHKKFGELHIAAPQAGRGIIDGN